MRKNYAFALTCTCFAYISRPSPGAGVCGVGHCRLSHARACHGAHQRVWGRRAAEGGPRDPRRYARAHRPRAVDAAAVRHRLREPRQADRAAGPPRRLYVRLNRQQPPACVPEQNCGAHRARAGLGQFARGAVHGRDRAAGRERLVFALCRAPAVRLPGTRAVRLLRQTLCAFFCT